MWAHVLGFGCPRHSPDTPAFWAHRCRVSAVAFLWPCVLHSVKSMLLPRVPLRRELGWGWSEKYLGVKRLVDKPVTIKTGYRVLGDLAQW